MATDSEIKQRGYIALKKELGELDMERFISLIIKDPFDYTVQQKNLLLEKELIEISKEAMVLRDKDQNNDELKPGLNTVEGKIVYKAVADAFNFKYTPVDEVMRGYME